MSSEDKQTNQVALTKADLTKSWFTWICFGQICYNYERMMGLGFCHSMIPILKRLYKDDKEKLADGMTRHLTFYNTENTWGAIIPGIVASLEESKANGQEIDDDTISNLKTALMGPLAGIGDAITQGLVKVILLAIAIDFALKGSPIGVVLFIVLFSAYAIGVSYVSYFSGYKLGKNAVLKLLGNNMIKDITEALGAMGMIVLGGLVAGNIKISTPMSFTMSGIVTEIQPLLDKIMPNFLHLVVFLIVYGLLRKGLTPIKTMGIIFASCVVLSLLGILA